MENILNKEKVEREIVPYLSRNKRGFPTRVSVSQIVLIILYKLKTGCQWRMLPVSAFENTGSYSWKSIYHHFRKWCRDGSWQKVWQQVLKSNKYKLDMSVTNLDGSLTPAKRGGEKVSYQARKKSKCTNMLYLTDNKGQILYCSKPMQGKHNDLFEIEKHLEQIILGIHQSGINYKGLFINADAGFDSKKAQNYLSDKDIYLNCKTNPRNKQPANRNFIFDKLMYNKQYVIERAFAWLDAFKALIIRYEKKESHWLALNFLAFSVSLINLKV